MKKLFCLIGLMSSVQVPFAQIKLFKLDSNLIPKSLHVPGHIVTAVKWTDSLGDNIVITSETGETTSKKIPDDAYRDAALFGYHYIQKGDSLKLIWKLYDFVKECPLDLKANFIDKGFAVTDLNKNGNGEIWLMYKTVCHGDVSPSNLKIIMYEGGKKYAIRGTTRVKVSKNEYRGGEFDLDEAFELAPEVFRQYAKQLWKKNVVENWR